MHACMHAWMHACMHAQLLARMRIQTWELAVQTGSNLFWAQTHFKCAISSNIAAFTQIASFWFCGGVDINFLHIWAGRFMSSQVLTGRSRSSHVVQGQPGSIQCRLIAFNIFVHAANCLLNAVQFLFDAIQLKNSGWALEGLGLSVKWTHFHSTFFFPASILSGFTVELWRGEDTSFLRSTHLSSRIHAYDH